MKKLPRLIFLFCFILLLQHGFFGFEPLLMQSHDQFLTAQHVVSTMPLPDLQDNIDDESDDLSFALVLIECLLFIFSQSDLSFTGHRGGILFRSCSEARYLFFRNIRI